MAANDMFLPNSTGHASVPNIANYNTGQLTKVGDAYIKEFWGRARSEVWQYFGFWADQKGQYLNRSRTVCRLCKGSVKYSGNTSALRSHLDVHHQYTINGLHGLPPEDKNIKLNLTNSGNTITPNCSRIQEDSNTSNVTPILALPEFNIQRASQVTESIIQYLVNDMQPPETVTMPGFQQMIHTLVPQYKLPLLWYFSDEIHDMYEDTKNRIFGELSNGIRHVITSDIWENATKDTFVTLSVSYIKSSFEVLRTVIQTSTLDDKHGMDFTEILSSAQTLWNLHDPIVVLADGQTMVTNDGNVNPWTVIPCLKHTIDRTMHAALKLPTVLELLEKVRKLIQHFHSNPGLEERLKHYMGVTDEEEQTSDLILATEDCDWTLILVMLEQVTKCQSAIAATLAESLPDIPDLGEIDNETVCSLVNIMKQFLTALDMFDSEEYPCASLILPTLYKLINISLAAEETDTNELLISFKKEVKDNLLSLYADASVERFLAMTSAIDPRLKRLYWMDEQSQTKAYYCLKDEAIKYHNQQSIVVDDEITIINIKQEPGLEDSNSSHESSNDDGPPEKRAKSIGGSNKKGHEGASTSGLAFLDDIVNIHTKHPYKARLSIEEQAQAELDRYLQKPPKDCSPLEWWKDKGVTFPLLSQVARSLLAVPATSFKSEQHLQYYRTRLNLDSADKIIFLHHNYTFQSNNDLNKT